MTNKCLVKKRCIVNGCFFKNERLNGCSQIQIITKPKPLEFKFLLSHLEFYMVLSRIVASLCYVEWRSRWVWLNAVTHLRESVSTLPSRPRKATTAEKRWGFQGSNWRGSFTQKQKEHRTWDQTAGWPLGAWGVSSITQNFGFLVSGLWWGAAPAVGAWRWQMRKYPWTCWETIFRLYKEHANRRGCWTHFEHRRSSIKT